MAIARRRFFDQLPIDPTAIAAEAGIGRTTLWRWFGNREALLGELLGTLSIETMEAVLRESENSDQARFMIVLERYFAVVTNSEPLLALIRRDPVGTVGVLMAPDGEVYGRLVDSTEEILREDSMSDGLTLTIEPRTLANLIVEIGMVHVWANFLTGEPPNVKRAVDAVRALTTPMRP